MKTIAYITDLHLGEAAPGEHGADAYKNFKRVLSDLPTRTIDELVVGGDIGTFEQYSYFFESLKPYKNLHISPGNHDTAAQVRAFMPNDLRREHAAFYSEIKEDYFHYLFMDSSTDKVNSEQMEWLQTVLKNAEQPLIVFIHHPVLMVDTIIDKKFPLQNRNEIKSLLLKYPKPVTIFCGHYHTEDVTTEGNITQYVTPAVSYQIKKEMTTVEGDATYFGYRMIYLSKSNIETETIILYPDDF